MCALVAAVVWSAAFGPAGAITIQIDYSHDTADFFNTQAKRDLMQWAADILAGRLGDTLAAITPTTFNTWTAQIFHPATGALADIGNLTVPADTIIVYAGGRDLGGSLAEGGPGGCSRCGFGSFGNTVLARGEVGASASPYTDFGPWGGFVSFNNDPSDANWHFGATTTGLTFRHNDFFSTAVHELGHVLGFGTSHSWDNFVTGSTFTGPKSVAEYDGAGNVPLAAGGGHWAEGTTDGGREAAMDPSLTNGTRKLFTALDWAALDDIGWDILPDGPAGDTNRDGVVDLADLNNVRNHFGQTGAGVLGDTNLDARVDLVDLNTVRNHFGEGAAASAVPEPGTLALALAGLAVLLARRLLCPSP